VRFCSLKGNDSAAVLRWQSLTSNNNCNDFCFIAAITFQLPTPGVALVVDGLGIVLVWELGRGYFLVGGYLFDKF
jgi:hypothetical protein